VTIEKTMTAAIMVEQVVCLVMRVFPVLGITDAKEDLLTDLLPNLHSAG
jgi:hypothetical protein